MSMCGTTISVVAPGKAHGRRWGVSPIRISSWKSRRSRCWRSEQGGRRAQARSLDCSTSLANKINGGNVMHRQSCWPESRRLWFARASLWTPADAQQFPSRIVKFVTQTPEGRPTCSPASSASLGARWGQPVIGRESRRRRGVVGTRCGREIRRPTATRCCDLCGIAGRSPKSLSQNSLDSVRDFQTVRDHCGETVHPHRASELPPGRRRANPMR